MSVHSRLHRDRRPKGLWLSNLAIESGLTDVRNLQSYLTELGIADHAPIRAAAAAIRAARVARRANQPPRDSSGKFTKSAP